MLRLDGAFLPGLRFTSKRALPSQRTPKTFCSETMETPESPNQKRNKTTFWPHAPEHRLSEGGTSFVTAGTYQKQRFFKGDGELRALHGGLHYVHANAVKHALVHVAKSYPWCSAGWFERTVKPAQAKTIGIWSAPARRSFFSEGCRSVERKRCRASAVQSWLLLGR